jgi:hypothetical protein
VCNDDRDEASMACGHGFLNNVSSETVDVSVQVGVLAILLQRNFTEYLGIWVSGPP